MHIIMVTIKIKPGHKDAFMEAMLGDALGSNQDEPGCLRFDVLQDVEEPNTIHLYEVYRDEAALEAHRQAPHYTKWREAVSDWFDGPVERRVGSNFYPPDNAWR